MTFDALPTRVRKAIDWAMFSAGALSLTIAIGGTILTNIEFGPDNVATVTEVPAPTPEQSVL